MRGLGGGGQQCLQSMDHSVHQSWPGAMHVDSGLANQAGDFIVCLKNFCFLGQGLSLSLELTGSARLVGH